MEKSSRYHMLSTMRRVGIHTWDTTRSETPLLKSCKAFAMMSSLSQLFSCFKASPSYTKLVALIKPELGHWSECPMGFRVQPFLLRCKDLLSTCQVIAEKLRISVRILCIIEVPQAWATKTWLWEELLRSSRVFLHWLKDRPQRLVKNN